MGMLSGGPIERTRAAVSTMIGASYHRGPDGNGSAEVVLGESALVLGHTRLSIIDLTDYARQPMWHPETGSCLIFNGEIYNFRQIRGELESCGETITSSGDTEVLLKALVRWGEAALPKFEGMFAFAYWDGRAQQLLLVRDPMGIKPLYYHSRAGEIIFASEVKVIVRSGACSTTLNPDAVNSFLSYGAVIGPETIHREIRELKPGHLLRVNTRGETSCAEYWSLQGALAKQRGRVAESAARNFDDAVGRIEERLEGAVNSQLVSDVPVGIFLSGGVDSSLLTLLGAKLAKSPITLLTVAFPEAEFSELPYARQIAQAVPHRHEVVTLTPENLREQLPAALSAMDQPTVDGINTFLISRVGASLGLKVLLNGIGGDELFGGYTTFAKVPQLLRFGNFARPVAGILSKLRTRNPIQWKKVADAGPLRGLAEAYLLQRSIRWRRDQGGAFAASEEASIAGLSNDFQKIAALELEIYARNQLLRDADVFSMASSVELRVPLLDLQLLDAALSLPAEFHFEGKRGKRITRRILQDLLGEPIPHRRKMGFTLPWQQWLRQSLLPTITAVIGDRSLYQPMGLDPNYGDDLLAGWQRGDRFHSWSEVWSLFVLLHWQQHTEANHAPA
jgi:asparagine synthase (glutamine-hydrolysing)